MNIFATDKAVLNCFKNYVKFSGRAKRFEYWCFVLFELVCSLILSFIPRIGTIASSIIGIGCFLPGLAVSWRRLHDTGRSGLFNLLPYAGFLFLIPAFCVAGSLDFEDVIYYAPVFLIISAVVYLALSIVVFVFACQKSQPGANKYGDEAIDFMAKEKDEKSNPTEKTDSNPSENL